MRLRTRHGTCEIEVDGVPLTVQNVSATERSGMLSRCSTITLLAGQPKELTDFARYNRELFIATVLSWSTVQDEDGEELPCTEETKARVAEWSPKWAGDVLDAAERAFSLVEAAEGKP